MKDEIHELRPERVAIGMSRPMLAAVVIGSALLGGLAAGLRNPGPQPVVSGEVGSAFTVWEKPLGSPTNEGRTVEPGSRVAFHEGYLVVTTNRGVRIVVPSDRVGPIDLKP